MLSNEREKNKQHIQENFFVVVVVVTFGFIKTGSHTITQAGLELEQSFCLSLLSAEITGVCHFFLKESSVIKKNEGQRVFVGVLFKVACVVQKDFEKLTPE